MKALLFLSAWFLQSEAPLESSPEHPAARAEAGEEILVEAERRDRRFTPAQPQSIGILNRGLITRSDGLFLQDSINLLPGVRFENRTPSGGQRITIRGYGNGTNFNGTGYKAYLDGIPITDAEGTTILDDIDFSTLESVEVLRGPISSLYGTGIGGVLRMYSLQPKPHTTRFTQELLGGQDALLRTNTRAEHATESSSVLANYGHQQYDGYRFRSRSKKEYALVSAKFNASSNQSLSVYGAFNHSFEELAGQLTDQQFSDKQNDTDPCATNKASEACQYVENNGHVSLDSARFGVSHDYEFSQAVSNFTGVHLSGYQLAQPFAVGRNENMALDFGGRTEFHLRFDTSGLGFAGVIGSEIQQTNSTKKSYALSRGELGKLGGDLQVRALQSNTFTQWDLFLPYELTLTAGASLNIIRYRIQDNLTNSANPDHVDQSLAKTFTPVITPRVAVTKAIGRHVISYAQLSGGYSPPTSSNLVVAQIGAVNRDLLPERATLYEIGTRGSLMDGRFAFELALFDIRITDKLTSNAVTSPDNGQVLYLMTTNAGVQGNRGLELAIRGAVSSLRPFLTYTFSSFRYDDFKRDINNAGTRVTVDYSGKRVVGVPPNLLNIGLDLALKWGIYLNGTYQYVDSMPLTYDNSQRAKSYSLLSAKLGYTTALDHFQLDVFAGAKNMLGSLYYTMVFLNASYSGAPPSVYLPGPYTTTFYGGMNLSYRL